MSDLKGLIPDSWACIDCGVNTAPGCSNRAQLEAAFSVISNTTDDGIEQHIGAESEVYTVREKVWKAARMQPFDGCLCIGCLEQRIRRRLKPEDFPRRHPFHSLPGTARLRNRRDGSP